MAVPTDQRYITAMNRDEELLRAPTRKRKPADIRRPERSRTVCTSLDMDMAPLTTVVHDDLEMSLLQDDTDIDILEKRPQPTPRNPSQSVNPTAPGAPRVTAASQNTVLSDDSLGNSLNLGSYPGSAFTQISPYTVLETETNSDSVFTIRRRWRHMTEVPGPNQWEKLPDEQVLFIFKWIPKTTLVKCARVCKRWYRLALDESLWRRIDLSSKTLKPGVVGRVIDRGAAVLRLAKSEILTPLVKMDPNSSVLNSSLLSCSLNSSANSSFNQPKFCRLQFLDLSMAVISTSGLEELVGQCQLLRKLSLENCEINDAVCRSIGQNMHLETLNLCMCQGLTENGLVPICNNLQRLDALNVAWTNMSRGAVVYLVICLPRSLTKLNLSGCRDTLLDEDVQQLCGSCPQLKELDLSDCTLLSAQSVHHISSLLHCLEYIALSRCYHVLPSSLTSLGNIMTLLALDVFGMLKECALIQLREALPNMQINKFPFSSIARPTTGLKRTSIWGLRVRDNAV